MKEILIIDHTDPRNEKLKQLSSNSILIETVNDKSSLEFTNLKICLFHKSNSYINQFAKSILEKYKDIYIIFYSGEGVEQSEVNALNSDRVLIIKEHIIEGTEIILKNLLSKLNNWIEDNQEIELDKLKKILGFDQKLESLLEKFSTYDPFSELSTDQKNAIVELNTHIETLIKKQYE